MEHGIGFDYDDGSLESGLRAMSTVGLLSLDVKMRKQPGNWRKAGTYLTPEQARKLARYILKNFPEA